MIRLYNSICKTYKTLCNCNELFLLTNSICKDALSMYKCPCCASPPENYVKNGNYCRYFIHMEDGAVHSQLISITIEKCSSCNKSHAVLHFLIIPYSQFSLGFIVTLLYFRLTRKMTVLEICDFFGISESTYHRLIQRAKKDAFAFSKIINELAELFQLITEIYNASFEKLQILLKSFFDNTGHSFMQPCITLRLTSKCT